MSEARLPELWRLLIALAVFAAAVLSYITRFENFFADEWSVVAARRAWNTNAILLPQNGHWSTGPILVWKALFTIFGLRTHLPYEIALLTAHVGAVLLLFVLVRRRSGDLPAFASALTLLVLGSGAGTIVWAFQVGLVGSVVFGLLAMLLLDGRSFSGRLVLTSAALLGSLMCSGVGLVFIVAIGVELALDRERWRLLLGLAAPIALYAAWFVTFHMGTSYVASAQCPNCVSTGISGSAHLPPRLDYLEALASFVVAGIESASGFVAGTTIAGAILVPILALIVALHWYRSGRVSSWQVGLLAGLVSWYVLIGLGPPQDEFAYSGNAYVGAVFLLPVVAEAISRSPWRGLWRPALVAIVAIGLVGNALQLSQAATNQTSLVQTETVELETAAAFRGAPDLALDRPLDTSLMSGLTAGSYFNAIHDLGSPVPAITPDMIPRLPSQPVDRVMVNLFGGALALTSDPNQSSAGLACRVVDSTSGSRLDFQASPGQRVMLQSEKAGDVFMFLGFLNPPSSEPIRHQLLIPGTPQWLHVPDTGHDSVWRVRIRTGATGAIHLCGSSNLAVGQGRGELYAAQADGGKLDIGWSVVTDVRAYDGHAALALAGDQPAYANDIFGSPFVPKSGSYDVWYRIKVRNSAGGAEVMKLGVWDDIEQEWLGATTYPPSQVGTTFLWVRVAAGLTPVAGHSLQFLGSYSHQLDTDWYVDEAVMLPSDLSTL